MSANQYLTQRERAAVMQYTIETVVDELVKGAQAGAAGAGVAAGGAAIAGKFMMGGFRTAAALSVVMGIPLGVAWHALESGSKITRNKERDSLNSISYYRNSAKNLENQLARRTSR